MSKRFASCSCGGLSVTVKAEPVKVSVCHCAACKKRTGSAFGVAAFFSRECAEIAGASQTFVRTGDSGKQLHFHFCPTCGTTLFWYPEFRPDLIAIAMGAFVCSTGLSPSQAVYEDQQVAWVQLGFPCQR
ncbi:GFA family protein [Neorhizobium sp. DT-125]|uniref:GFA family protein n=1 Tax=Neorhizobium sp. DT-125 TaxID=3396163 RepID=UPI003F1C3450